MDSIGAEVGQKMRSAIKAKLMELECYVDDELPDYIMVMVANRRTKSQMNEDLNLFLSSKTSTFVNWLHIVLKKLKEVTVTNPEVYKKVSKRKSNEDMPDDKSYLKVKKEKSSKKLKKESQTQPSGDNLEVKTESTSLTDDLPISANKLAEKRKIILNNEDQLDGDIVEDNFDIPLLSEVNESSNERELQDIERKIRNVKSRLGILVESDNEENLALKAEKDHINEKNMSKQSARKIQVVEKETSTIEEPEKSSQNLLGKDRRVLVEETAEDKTAEEKKIQHKRITFENDEEESQVRSGYSKLSSWRSKQETGRKPSVLDRLGKRPGSPDSGRRISLRKIREEEEKFLGYRSNRGRSTSRDRDRSKRETKEVNSRIKRNKSRSRSRERSPYKSRDRDSKKEGVLRRLGVQSKVAVIKKPEIKPPSSDEEEEKVIKKVSSLIKVKPRVIPSDVPQPNKNLLLKAVADAQRSIAQTPTVGKDVKDALFTKKYREKQTVSNEAKLSDEKSSVKKQLSRISSRMKSRLQHSSDEFDSDGEYIPKPVKNVEGSVPSYIPSSAPNTDDNTKENGKQQFIITLDGIEKTMFAEKKVLPKTRLEGKKTPSPIIFDDVKATTDTSTRKNIPDKLPVVHPPLSIKNKERCKYWPSCRQGDKCEFVHPSQTCETFPHCKFGDKCLFIHPKCKFGSSCTKRDCPYDHFKATKSLSSSKLPLSTPTLQNCKFFPNCTNLQCPFYHPKPCKYGKYCKNIPVCTFSHSFVTNKKNLSWRSK